MMLIPLQSLVRNGDPATLTLLLTGVATGLTAGFHLLITLTAVPRTGRLIFTRRRCTMRRLLGGDVPLAAGLFLVSLLLLLSVGGRLLLAWGGWPVAGLLFQATGLVPAMVVLVNSLRRSRSACLLCLPLCVVLAALLMWTVWLTCRAAMLSGHILL